MTHHSHRIVAASLLAGALSLAPTAVSAAVPQGLTEQGRLFDQAGGPLQGTVHLTFTLYDAAVGGAVLWTETQAVPLDSGYFSVVLGEAVSIPTAVWNGSVRWLGIRVEADPEMSPRQATQSAPYALVAGDAVGDINPHTVTINGTLVIDANGNWVGPSSGLVGPTGAQGPQGIQGPAGAQGVAGPQGPQGAIGPTGPTGPAGAQGIQGVAGPTGAQGIQGVAGATGAQGIQGVAGPTGAQGIQGVAGPTGAQGIQGVAGATGAQGIQGVAGATGAQGIQGVAGATGAAGPTGAQGIQGMQGVQGVTGPTGPQGLTGLQGPAGPAGPQGITGANGAQGSAGPAGATGATGPAGAPGASAGSGVRSYVVAMAMRTGAGCPAGWNLENFSNLMGSNAYVYAQISGGGFVLGGVDSPNYGQEYNYTGIASSSGITKYCWREFQTRGKPFTHVLSGTAGLTCPSGYISLPASELKGNNGYAYAIGTQSGFYLGYVDTWAEGAQTYQHGWIRRTFVTDTVNVCLRVYGTEDDQSTALGVFPMVFGVKSAAACPTGQGFTYTQTSGTLADATDDWSYMDITDNSAMWGSLNAHSYGGENYMFAQFHGTYQINYCYKMYARTAKPQVTLHSQPTACAAGQLSFSLANINGWNANVYYMKNEPAMYLGGLYQWDRADYADGSVYDNWTSGVSNFCVGATNVASFP